MTKRIAVRLLSILITLFLVSLAVYSLEYLSLGDSLSIILSEEATEENFASYSQSIGYSTGYLAGYLRYISSFFRLEWGKTISGQSIASVIFSRLPLTLSLSCFSLLLSIVFSFSWAVLAVMKKGRIAKAGEAFSLFAMSLPSFLISLILILLFGVLLKLFPVAGYVPASVSLPLYLKSMFLPSLSLAIVSAPLYLRIYKAELERQAESSYSLSIIAQGGDRKDVILYSALKPSLLFGISILSESFASALAGSAVVESVFALPGFGSLMVAAALSRDMQLSGITILVISIMVSAVYLVSETLQLVLDPRVRRRGEEA